MSKKTLLSESQIRRFMTLANQQPLAAGYIGRGQAAGIISEQEEDMMGAPEGFEDEGADPVGPDMGADMGMAGDSAADEATVEELVGEIAKTITQVTGVVVTAESDEDVEGDLGGPEEVGDELEVPMADAGPEAGLDDEPMLETRRWVRAQLQRLLSEQGMPPGPGGPPPGAGGPPMGAPPMGAGPGPLPPGPPGAGGGLPPIPPEAMGPLMALVRALSGGAGGPPPPGPMAEGTHMPSGANENELIGQGTNSNRDFEKDDNRQSSAGQHHMGGGAAKASRTHMGGASAGLPLQEGITDDLLERVTRRVAAKLLNRKR